MRPLKRMSVNKGKSSATFRKVHSKTKKPNVQPPPMRGGYRL